MTLRSAIITGTANININGTVGATTANTGAFTTVTATSIKFGSGAVLNSYEEGTWTPVITAGVGSFTSYTSQGIYTKVGRIVTAWCSFKITAVGTGNTFCTVAGYPLSLIHI